MNAADYLRPDSLADALRTFARVADAAGAGEPDDGAISWLAGGQSLIAAMKLGLAAPASLVDLQDVPELRGIRVETAPDGSAALWIGAMATHARIARSELVADVAPGLCALAGGIGDAQVRTMGTIGGSLAHNDPAACWPAGVLAAGATIVTSRREIAADDWFTGLYRTALEAGELLVGVRFPQPARLHYLKFEQPASRFAVVGIAVGCIGADGRAVRVAATGLGMGAVRWRAAERALARGFGLAALESVPTDGPDGLEAVSDLHGSADYRRHLARVLTRRCVSALTGEQPPAQGPLSPRVIATAAPAAVAADTPRARGEGSREGFGGARRLAESPADVWRTLLDPRHLQACIPGCEALAQTGADAYEATVKVGLGPLSVRFRSEVLIRDPRPPESMSLVFRGDAGTLGRGEGTAQVRLEAQADGGTQLHWWVRVHLGGRLAQFGNRLVESTARSLSGTFFDRLEATLRAGAVTGAAAGAPRQGWWRRLLHRLFPFLGQ